MDSGLDDDMSSNPSQISEKSANYVPISFLSTDDMFDCNFMEKVSCANSPQKILKTNFY